MKKVVTILAIMLVLTACRGKNKDQLYSEGVKQLNLKNPAAAVVLFKSALEKDENYLEARFHLAEAYAKLGKTEQAEKEFLKVLNQNPARDEALLELAELYNGANKPNEAFKLGEKYLTKYPGKVVGLEILGISCAVAKKYEDAERYLQQALNTEPTRSKTKIELAAVYASSGKEKTAKELLSELIKTDNTNLRAYYLLATIENGTGNADKAVEVYQQILKIKSDETLASYKAGLIYIEKGDLEKAGKTADELNAKYPKNADGLRLKGMVKYSRKEYAEAVTSLQSSLKIMPTLEGYYFLGLCLYEKGELESALSQFRRVLDHVPSSRQARIMTGVILLNQKRTDDAINELKKVLKDDDRVAVAHNLLGNAYMAKGMFEEGMWELNRATVIDPKIVDAYLKKGYFYLSRGKLSEGEAEFTTAVKMAPDALNSRLMLASYHFRQGKPVQALDDLRAGLSGKKGDALLYNGIATVLFFQNKLDEGIKNIKKAKEIDPAFPGSYHNLATYYAATNNYDKAIDEYSALIRIDPHNYQGTLGLAILNEIKGNDKEALAYYQKATDSKRPEAFLAQASYFLKKREPEKALKALDEALKIDARNVAILEMKGRILINQKSYKDGFRVFDEIETVNPDAGIALKITAYVSMKEIDKALKQARRIIEKYPSSARGYMLLASVYEAQKDYQHAIGEVKNGLRQDSNNVQAILYLGKLYEINKEYSLAMSAYTDASKKKTDFVPAIFAQGALLDITGHKNEAIGKYREVLEKSDNYLPALNNLAYLFADGYGKKEEALRLAISAFKQDPGNAGVMDTLGFALLKNSRKDDAKKVLEKAVSLLPNEPTVSYHLGLAYKETGDNSNATRMLQKAISLGEFSDANSARSLLGQLKK